MSTTGELSLSEYIAGHLAELYRGAESIQVFVKEEEPFSCTLRCEVKHPFANTVFVVLMAVKIPCDRYIVWTRVRWEMIKAQMG